MLSSFVRGDQLLLRVPGVLTIGSPMVDLIAHVDEKTLQRLGAVRSSAIPVTADHFSQILGKLRRPVKRAVGGSAANVACALARMSGRTSFIGRIGTDHEGIYCRDVLKEEGVNVWISVDLEKPTGRVLVLVTPDGERSMISCLGASENFNVNELTGLEFHQMGIVHIEGYHLSHFEATLRLMQMAKGQGARISIDLASVEWVKNKKKEFIFVIREFASVLFGNLCEMQELTGLQEPQEISAALSSYVELVFLTLGAEGVWVGKLGQSTFFPALRVDPVDTTGAGDLFCAGILHGLRWYWNLEESIQLAQELARTVVQREGAHLTSDDWLRIRSYIE